MLDQGHKTLNFQPCLIQLGRIGGGVVINPVETRYCSPSKLVDSAVWDDDLLTNGVT